MPRSTHIGPYRILRLINQGGQGSVYLGFDERLHRRVAIKIYRLPRDKKERRGLLHEAQLVASIQSAKVVQIYDLIISNNHVALIMEYVAGCDLEDFLIHRQPCLASIVAICSDVTGALAAARQQQIVHGDLKASNILITVQGRAKLTDFGIARGVGALETPTAASLSCISPEQYLGRPLDVRSDLFALGCLLYRMLTGNHPFVRAGELDRQGLLEHMPQKVEELVSESLSVPPELSRLLSALLQKSPEGRPGNTHQVRSTLREIARDIPLNVGNTLQQEAGAFFRKESPEDIPPLVPSDLTRNWRSGMKQKRTDLWLSFFARRRTIGSVLAVVITSMLFAKVLVQAYFTEQTPVVIEAPFLEMTTAAELPEEISARWLAGEIEIAVGDQHGRIAVDGGLAATQNKTFYSRGVVAGSGRAGGNALLRVQSKLHCADQLCLFAVVLKKDGQQFIEREVIIANMPVSQWSDIVRSTTMALLARAE